jgi:hypothetical protein
MKRNTVFTARTPETDRALAASTSVTRKTRARLTTKTPKPRAVVGGYKIYRPTSQPEFRTKVQDLRGSGCVYFQIQRKARPTGCVPPSAATRSTQPRRERGSTSSSPEVFAAVPTTGPNARSVGTGR